MTQAFNAGFNVSSNPAGNTGDAGGSGFLPNSISSLILWLAADRITGLGNGDSVSAWPDLSGNENGATQGTGSAQPTYNTDQQAGLPTVIFDGSTDFMTLSSDLHNLTEGDNVIFVVSQTDTNNADQRVLNMTASATTVYSMHYSSSVGTVNYINSSATPVSGTGFTDSNYNIFRGTRDGTTQEISINADTEVTNASATSNVADEAALGSNGQGVSNFLDGAIAEILIYERVLTTAEEDRIQSYLSNKWGITLA